MNCIRNFGIVILLLLVANCLQAQLTRGRYYNEDSLRMILEGNPNDTTRIILLLQLAGSYFHRQPDTSLLYATQALELSSRSKSTHYHILSISRVGEAMNQSGRFSDAMKMHLEALELSQKAGNGYMETNSYGFIGMTYLYLQSYDYAFYYLKKAIAGRENLRHDGSDRLFLVYMARAYNETDKPDSSFYFLAEAKEIPIRSQASQLSMSYTNALGDAFLLVKDLDSANFYYRLALTSGPRYQNFRPNYLSEASVGLATVFMKKNLVDSALYFARYAYSVVAKKKLPRSILDASSLLAQLHEKTGKLDSALYYQHITSAMNDSIYGKDKFNGLQLLLLQEQKRVQEAQRSEERYRNTILLIGLVSITTVILIASILLFRSNRLKHKTNQALQKTLTELKSTQSQLIQSEKMASLGELTAGIAHEIQNPLNFVNNFSEVNAELIDDLKKEMASGNRQSADEIANSIKENQEKINHHGKRADGIVKSMLQHSRISSGQKELTDLNTLCEEYVRLAYHGFKAKDKSFNANFETNLDKMLPKIEVVTRDIGRVILNLINNAFYAVGEKSKNHKGDYVATVRISTKSVGNKIEIRVEDNGNGIPESLRAKIFQPFFTTKPTGQGTGLGLSLSYDIIKAHGGTLEVNSPPAGRAGKEGKGAEFIIQLSI